MNYLIVGDIHNNYIAFVNSYNYAKQNNLGLVYLGDLVDYGTDAMNTILFAKYLVSTNQAVFIEGNHDNKINRFLQGNPIKVHSPSMQTTIDALESELVKDAFEKVYDAMIPYYKIGSAVMTHGGVAESFWTSEPTSKEITRTFLYGAIDNDKPFIEHNGQRYPHRTYGWTNAVPNGTTVIVGHDRSPLEVVPTFDNNINEVLIHTNDQGGKIIFTDTGSGKGGFVSGVIIDSSGTYQETVEFK